MNNKKIRRSCSRQLPRPMRIWSPRKGLGSDKLLYIIYPDLSQFRKACSKCRFLKEAHNGTGRFKICAIEDKDFILKYYFTNEGKSNKQVWFGTIPPNLKTQAPKLYRELESFIEEGRARSFRRQLSSGSKRVALNGQTKTGVTDGETSCLVGSKASRIVLGGS